MTDAARRRVVFVSGLSGAGKASILRALEDLGYEAIDNPPAALIEEMVTGAPDPTRQIAVGVDVRSHGFSVDALLDVIGRMRANPALNASLVFAYATEAVLQRRFTETRRRHPLSPQGRVIDGIAAEQMLTGPLRDIADVVLDTTDLSLAALRRHVAESYGAGASDPAGPGMSLSLLSFAYPAGLPRDADMVFDARFLRNPHYMLHLRPRTGQDPEVAAYVAADPDFEAFFARMADLLALVLPRFVQEGKKYATIAIGCTGGRHRSVMLVEKLASHLSHPAKPGTESRNPARPGTETASPAKPGTEIASLAWRVSVTHRELNLEAARAAAAPSSLEPALQVLSPDPLPEP
jgi:UPF0042 nucleotide-binding protein